MSELSDTRDDFPLELCIDDDPGEAIEIRRGGALIATVHNFYEFPCLDDDRLEEVDAEAKRTANIFAASDDLLRACKRALQFINNGVEFGYILMPDAGTGDPALECPDLLRDVIAKAEGKA